MANYCCNKLTVYKNKSNYNELLNKIKQAMGGFDRIFNILAPIKEDDEGVKVFSEAYWWGSTDIFINRTDENNTLLEHDDRFELFFETSWKPPLRMVPNFAKHWDIDKLQFDYCEGGAGLAGSLELCYGDIRFEEIDFNDENAVKEFLNNTGLGIGG